MAEGVLMPKAGITVEECVITEWLKKPGDQVAVGDILFTYETDKATFECESTAAGTLLEIFYNDGDEVPVLVNVCAIGNPGDDVSALKGASGEAAPAAAAPAPEAAPAPAAAPAAPTGPVAQGVLMPKAGITVEECIITEWLKKVGDQISVGDILFTYETDKATFECESTAAGTLLEIFYNDGDEVPVLVNVCAIGNPGDSTVGLRAGEEAPVAAPAEAAPAASAAPVAAATPVAAVAAAANPDAKVSPRAKMIAETLGVDPTQAAPTGPYGRVIERDVRALAQAQALSPAAAPVAEAAPAKAEAPAAAPVAAAPEADYVDEKFSAIRKATAKAMVRSLSTMAQLTHQHSFDASTILNLRKQLKANGEAMGMPNITINDLVMFAVSRVILNHPQLNATMPEENMIRKYNNVHLGMAVDTPKGLMVPTIFNANKLSLAELSIEAKRLAKLCQEGKATPDMLSGASFTVSNVGSLGVEVFTPVVNPPQVGILGVCGTTTRIKEVNGEIKTYPGMNLCLSYDHRALDGTPASKFMKELCQALENFSLLMMK
ncbi:MAG: 2-oxo acid dehydrogenase subunit E2 [Tyzzerella sp.]|nr:2-oxo acid dehydrogenase subunit E2 [Tyzzerella sp.]